MGINFMEKIVIKIARKAFTMARGLLQNFPRKFVKLPDNKLKGEIIRHD